MMISKPTRGYGIALWMLMLGVLSTNTGCQIFSTIAYLTIPNDVPAECEELEGSKVVVIVHDVGGLGYQDATVPTDLARFVSGNLNKNVKGIEVVGQDEINDWIDNSNEIREEELGKAMNADKVVSIQLEHFRLNKGPNLYQGHAEIVVQVFDTETGDVEDLEPMELLYPPLSGVPLEESESHFRRRFVNVLAKQVGRRFYAHESLVASEDRLYPSE